MGRAPAGRRPASITIVEDPAVIGRILRHLGLQATIPKPCPARSPRCSWRREPSGRARRDRAPPPVPVSWGTSQPAGSAPCAHVSLPCIAPWHPFAIDDRLSCGYRRANSAPRPAGKGESARGQSVFRPVRAGGVRRAGVPGGQDDLECANADYRPFPVLTDRGRPGAGRRCARVRAACFRMDPPGVAWRTPTYGKMAESLKAAVC